MTLRRQHLTAASLLVLVMKVFSGLALTCQQTEYQKGDECCPVCPVGNRVKADCTDFTTTLCLPCSEGTFMNQPTGLTQCFPCTHCDKDFGLKIKSPCTATSDTVCEPLEGFYCVDSSHDGCYSGEKHTNCKPGQYISKKGTSSTDTVCSNCSEGTFSDGTFTSCQPHTQCETINLHLLTPGTALTDAECGGQSFNTIISIIITLPILLIVLIVFTFYLVRIIKKHLTHQAKTRTNNPRKQKRGGESVSVNSSKSESSAIVNVAEE